MDLIKRNFHPFFHEIPIFKIKFKNSKYRTVTRPTVDAPKQKKNQNFEFQQL